MIRIRRPLTLAGVLAIGGLLGPGPASAPAQQVIYAPAAPVVVVAAAPMATVVTPSPRQTRRELRRANQYNYTTMRPVYGNRPGVTFAPYSDRYFPKAVAPQPTYYASPPQPTYYVSPPQPTYSMMPRR